MAASDAIPVPRKNTAFRLYFPLFDADGDLVTSAATRASQVSIDGGAFTNVSGTTATEIGTAGIYYIDIDASGMNGDSVVFRMTTSTSGAKTAVVFLYPESAGDVRADAVQISGDTTAADNFELFFDGTGYNAANSTVGTVTTVTTTTTLTNLKLKKNTALSNFMFVMISTSDNISPATGLTVTAERSIDGAAFGAAANAVSEVSNGVYKINLAAADLNGDTVALKFTATGAVTTLITLVTQ